MAGDKASGDPEAGERLTEGVISSLFGELGGAGKIKVYRRQPGEPDAYAGTLDVSSELEGEIDEVLAGRFGSGVYSLKGFLHGKCVRCATRAVARPAQLPGTPGEVARAPGPTVGDVQTAIEAARHAEQSRSIDMVKMLLEVEERASQRLERILAALAPRVHEGASAGAPSAALVAAGAPDSLEKLDRMVQFLGRLGWQAPASATALQPAAAPEADGDEAEIGMGERLLRPAVREVGRALGSVLAAQASRFMAPGVSATPAPASAGSASAVPVPAAPAPASPPAGTRALSEVERERVKRARAVSAAPAAASSEAEISPAAGGVKP